MVGRAARLFSRAPPHWGNHRGGSVPAFGMGASGMSHYYSMQVYLSTSLPIIISDQQTKAAEPCATAYLGLNHILLHKLGTY